jgi:hypothetical protein
MPAGAARADSGPESDRTGAPSARARPAASIPCSGIEAAGMSMHPASGGGVGAHHHDDQQRSVGRLLNLVVWHRTRSCVAQRGSFLSSLPGAGEVWTGTGVVARDIRPWLFPFARQCFVHRDPLLRLVYACRHSSTGMRLVTPRPFWQGADPGQINGRPFGGRMDPAPCPPQRGGHGAGVRWASGRPGTAGGLAQASATAVPGRPEGENERVIMALSLADRAPAGRRTAAGC